MPVNVIRATDGVRPVVTSGGLVGSVTDSGADGFWSSCLAPAKYIITWSLTLLANLANVFSYCQRQSHQQATMEITC